jgi:hypothetical protein
MYCIFYWMERNFGATTLYFDELFMRDFRKFWSLFRPYSHPKKLKHVNLLGVIDMEEIGYTCMGKRKARKKKDRTRVNRKCNFLYYGQKIRRSKKPYSGPKLSLVSRFNSFVCNHLIRVLLFIWSW